MTIESDDYPGVEEGRKVEVVLRVKQDQGFLDFRVAFPLCHPVAECLAASSRTSIRGGGRIAPFSFGTDSSYSTRLRPLHAPEGSRHPSSVHPVRYLRRSSSLASGELVTRPSAPSYSSFLPTR